MPPLPKTPDKLEHDKWFDEQVGIALKEADDPQTAWIDHKEVNEDWESRRSALVKRVAKQDKPA